MRKRLISIYIVVILIFGICGCAQTAADASAAETETVEYAEIKEVLGEDVASGTTIDFHVFDFNDDGLNDYLICIDGLVHSGSGGNHVEIDVQEEGETFRKVLDFTAPTIDNNPQNRHQRVTVLDEKSDGFYAIVVPGSNRILRYDKNEDWYKFHDGE